ncbi:chromosome transmission fidelity protein 8 [Lipomyces arxii]|uniref:chromosome transmission fidelity protein 8 n=1 Tax=Lipomyces arxii TaxID=56418 RepID=UPI0034CE9FB3
MPLATIELRSSKDTTGAPNIGLPTLLQTSSGLALVEIQGTLHLSLPEDGQLSKIGRLTMDDKVVWLWVGDHQRMEGKIVDLIPPFGVLQRVQDRADKTHSEHSSPNSGNVEIVEIIRKKVVFKIRPEPIVT